MRKVIDNKVYNSETAEEVASWGNGYCPDDFNYYHETLHRTTSGNWFLLKDGGAKTEMAARKGNMTYGSTDIVALTEEDAFNWCKENQSRSKTVAHALENCFGDKLTEA